MILKQKVGIRTRGKVLKKKNMVRIKDAEDRLST